MAGETLFAQIIHEAPSAPMRGKSLLPVCCICRRLRDETGPSLDDKRWVTQRTYRKTHGMNPAHFLLPHTYCPKCFAQVMDRMKAS